MPSSLRHVLLLIAAALVLPASAHGARVVVHDAPPEAYFVAGDGERNRLTISEQGGAVVFSDPGAARLRTGRGCKRTGRHEVRCRGAVAVEALLGDGPDVAVARGGPGGGTVIRGGGGPDSLSGQGILVFFGDSGNDVVRGSRLGDDIHGGRGRDRIYGGRGDDWLFDDERDSARAPDILRGGRGLDLVDYSRRRRGLDIDLARPRVLRGAKADQITSVERARGGRGDDRLAGTDGHNLLDGRGGDDTILGRAAGDLLYSGRGDNLVLGGRGNDLLASGGNGRERFRGGPGNDALETMTGYFPIGRGDKPDSLDCGDGTDDLTAAPPDIARRCERAGGWANALEVPVQPKVRGAAAVYRAYCLAPLGETCAGTVRLQSPTGTALGSADFEIPDGRRTDIAVTLTAAGQDAFARGAAVRVRFRSSREMRFLDPEPGEQLTFGYTANMLYGQ